MIRKRTVAILLLIVAAGCCFAKPPFYRVFLATYNVDPNSALGKAKCLTCHQAPAPPRLNPYGQAVYQELQKAKSRMITSEMLHAIEKLDSDGDGFTNIEEIRAGTLPGDATSKPSKHEARPGLVPSKKNPPKGLKAAAAKHKRRHHRRRTHRPSEPRGSFAYPMAGIALVFAGAVGLAKSRSTL